MDGHSKIIIVKKRKKSHGGHHGGSWNVAYADFVTAMMAFFLVMWIMGMEEGVRDVVEGYFSNPVGSLLLVAVSGLLRFLFPLFFYFGPSKIPLFSLNHCTA